MSSGLPFLPPAISFTSGSSISVNREENALRSNPTTGAFERWNAPAGTWDPVASSTSSTSGITEQPGLPAAAPIDRSQPSTIFSTSTDTTWQWDVADQLWRTIGKISETVTGNIPANSWTDFPAFSLVSTFDTWKIYDSNQTHLSLVQGRRRPSDQRPQVFSINPYTNALFEAIGEGVINVP